MQATSKQMTTITTGHLLFVSDSICWLSPNLLLNESMLPAPVAVGCQAAENWDFRRRNLSSGSGGVAGAFVQGCG
jgi:hypothetical protein